MENLSRASLIREMDADELLEEASRLHRIWPGTGPILNERQHIAAMETGLINDQYRQITGHSLPHLSTIS